MIPKVIQKRTDKSANKVIDDGAGALSRPTIPMAGPALPRVPGGARGVPGGASGGARGGP